MMAKISDIHMLNSVKKSQMLRKWLQMDLNLVSSSTQSAIDYYTTNVIFLKKNWRTLTLFVCPFISLFLDFW